MTLPADVPSRLIPAQGAPLTSLSSMVLLSELLTAIPMYPACDTSLFRIVLLDPPEMPIPEPLTSFASIRLPELPDSRMAPVAFTTAIPRTVLSPAVIVSTQPATAALSTWISGLPA